MPKVISSVKALLLYQGKFLILKEELRKGEVWDLPGGKIEYGESPEDSLKREVKEEINVDIAIEKSVGVWFFYSKNNRHQIICHTFLCKPIGQMQIDTNENPANENFTALKWLTPKEILNNREIKITASLTKLLSNLEV